MAVAVAVVAEGGAHVASTLVYPELAVTACAPQSIDVIPFLAFAPFVCVRGQVPEGGAATRNGVAVGGLARGPGVTGSISHVTLAETGPTFARAVRPLPDIPQVSPQAVLVA